MEIKNEFYKPRSLGTNNELDVIMEAILNQNSMAMDSAYVDDVCMHVQNDLFFLLDNFVCAVKLWKYFSFCF